MPLTFSRVGYWLVHLLRRRSPVWRAFARDVGAECVEGAFGVERVIMPYGPWRLTLYTHSSGFESTSTHTLIEVRLPRTCRFECTIRRKSWFDRFNEMAGIRSLPLPDPELESRYFAEGNSKSRIHNLLSNPNILGVLEAEPSLVLTISGSDGNYLPSGERERYMYLSLRVNGTVKDLRRLRGLRVVATEVLDSLERACTLKPPRSTRRSGAVP